MTRVAIIGGGACGLTLASLLKDKYDVCLFERNSKLGKKILASGNGKCNFTNVGDYRDKYNNEFAQMIINRFDSKFICDYFASLGVSYRIDEEKRVYPLSESSATILEALKNNLKGVKIILDAKVNSLEEFNDKVRVNYNKSSELFDYVVCASGSSASLLGSDSAYEYLINSGVNITELRPSLTPLKVKENIKDLDGVRVKCLVKLYKDDKEVYSEHGEVLFKKDALSGIVIYNMSSMINRDYKHNYTIGLDLLSDKCNDKYKLEYSVHPKLVDYLKNKNPADIRFTFTSLYHKDNAQVISGGIDVNEINDDLSYKKNSHIYFGGEVIDVDGMCGGYNLQFAFSCAFTIRVALDKVNK